MSRGGSKQGGRSQLLMFLVLVAILGGAGTWNYRRNVAAEGREVRPYRTLSEADLDTLIAAYEQEIEALSGRYERASRKRASGGGGDGDRWGEFEQVQRHSRAVREMGYQLSEREGALGELKKEEQRRASAGDGIQRFLKRLLGVRIS